jgi:hypothetical protein
MTYNNTTNNHGLNNELLLFHMLRQVEYAQDKNLGGGGGGVK